MKYDNLGNRKTKRRVRKYRKTHKKRRKNRRKRAKFQRSSNKTHRRRRKQRKGGRVSTRSTSTRSASTRSASTTAPAHCQRIRASLSAIKHVFKQIVPGGKFDEPTEPVGINESRLIQAWDNASLPGEQVPDVSQIRRMMINGGAIGGNLHGPLFGEIGSRGEEAWAGYVVFSEFLKIIQGGPWPNCRPFTWLVLFRRIAANDPRLKQDSDGMWVMDDEEPAGGPAGAAAGRAADAAMAAAMAAAAATAAGPAEDDAAAATAAGLDNDGDVIMDTGPAEDDDAAAAAASGGASLWDAPYDHDRYSIDSQDVRRYMVDDNPNPGGWWECRQCHFREGLPDPPAATGGDDDWGGGGWGVPHADHVGVSTFAPPAQELPWGGALGGGGDGGGGGGDGGGGVPHAAHVGVSTFAPPAREMPWGGAFGGGGGGGGTCTTALQCSLNGDCVDGRCVCDAGWTGGDCSASAGGQADDVAPPRFPTWGDAARHDFANILGDEDGLEEKEGEGGGGESS